MPAEIRRFIAYTRKGEAAADLEARIVAAGGTSPDGPTTGRKFVVWTDEGELSADFDARMAALGLEANSASSDTIHFMYTTRGESAANLENRLSQLVT